MGDHAKQLPDGDVVAMADALEMLLVEQPSGRECAEPSRIACNIQHPRRC